MNRIVTRYITYATGLIVAASLISLADGGRRLLKEYDRPATYFEQKKIGDLEINASACGLVGVGLGLIIMSWNWNGILPKSRRREGLETTATSNI